MPSFFDDHARNCRWAIRFSIAAVFFSLIQFAAVVARSSPHERDWFEQNKPEWVTEMRKAIETRRLRQAQQLEQKQIPTEQH